MKGFDNLKFMTKLSIGYIFDIMVVIAGVISMITGVAISKNAMTMTLQSYSVLFIILLIWILSVIYNWHVDCEEHEQRVYTI